MNKKTIFSLENSHHYFFFGGIASSYFLLKIFGLILLFKIIAIYFIFFAIILNIYSKNIKSETENYKGNERMQLIIKEVRNPNASTFKRLANSALFLSISIALYFAGVVTFASILLTSVIG